MLVNIVIPVYNGENYLSQCLDSVMSQSYDSWKAIVIDDGSNDASGDIAEAYQKKDERFVVVHKVNEGQFKARIDGVRISDGDIVMFLDSDDWWSPFCLEKIVGIFEKHDVDVVCFPGQAINEYGEHLQMIGRITEESGIIQKKMVYEKIISSHALNSLWTKAFKRSLFDLNELERLEKKAMRLAEDKLMQLPLMSNAQNIYYTSDVLYYYRHHCQSISHRYDISRITEMLAEPVFMETYRYMKLWNMDDRFHKRKLELYYLRHVLACYFNIRRSCKDRAERSILRQYPWKNEIKGCLGLYMLSGELTVKEKIKLLVMRLSL